MSSSFAEELEIRGLRRFLVVIRFIRFFRQASPFLQIQLFPAK